ncbi:flagellar hook basal-body protein [Trinickia terrae]|uniref:Flagellar hook basal-body protein n=1 Tax=Trinickia terrae TaxID=2571161 RepID=A0A4U1I804_9BURK|nr:flagellar hook basal-body protein [Trinickia terrae]TKC89467.1 flagellar hook basal-body protein [Trinickia terrae]
MDDLMTLATRLISLETQRVESAGRNIANTATPGYKREIAFAETLAEATGGGAAPVAAASPVLRTATDFSAGKLVHTGNPLDLSITGPGFFEVATADGPAYTRLGSFQRDADGRLVTTQGWPLQGANGDVIVSSGDWRVERDGTVIDGGNTVSVIRIANFDDPAKLVRLGDGLYAADGSRAMDVEDPHIAQGFAEGSNAVAASDMIQLMEAMRRVESGQKLVHAYDDMVGNVLQRLGDM